VRVTERMIEIFHRGQRVGLHERRYMRSGHGTAPEHMPNARRATPRGRRIAFVAGRRRSARTPSDSSSLCSHAASSRAGLSNLPRRVEALSRHRRRPAGLKLPAMIKRMRRFPFVFLTTATHWRPTTAPNGRSGPASLSQGHLLLSQRLGRRTLYRYSLGDRDRTAPRPRCEPPDPRRKAARAARPVMSDPARAEISPARSKIDHHNTACRHLIAHRRSSLSSYRALHGRADRN
jgi:hypothetical protein